MTVFHIIFLWRAKGKGLYDGFQSCWSVLVQRNYLTCHRLNSTSHNAQLSVQRGKTSVKAEILRLKETDNSQELNGQQIVVES